MSSALAGLPTASVSDALDRLGLPGSPTSSPSSASSSPPPSPTRAATSAPRKRGSTSLCSPSATWSAAAWPIPAAATCTTTPTRTPTADLRHAGLPQLHQRGDGLPDDGPCVDRAIDPESHRQHQPLNQAAPTHLPTSRTVRGTGAPPRPRLGAVPLRRRRRPYPDGAFSPARPLSLHRVRAVSNISARLG